MGRERRIAGMGKGSSAQQEAATLLEQQARSQSMDTGAGRRASFLRGASHLISQERGHGLRVRAGRRQHKVSSRKVVAAQTRDAQACQGAALKAHPTAV